MLLFLLFVQNSHGIVILDVTSEYSLSINYKKWIFLSMLNGAVTGYNSFQETHFAHNDRFIS